MLGRPGMPDGEPGVSRNLTSFSWSPATLRAGFFLALLRSWSAVEADEQRSIIDLILASDATVFEGVGMEKEAQVDLLGKELGVALRDAAPAATWLQKIQETIAKVRKAEVPKEVVKGAVGSFTGLARAYRSAMHSRR